MDHTFRQKFKCEASPPPTVIMTEKSPKIARFPSCVIFIIACSENTRRMHIKMSGESQRTNYLPYLLSTYANTHTYTVEMFTHRGIKG